MEMPYHKLNSQFTDAINFTPPKLIECVKSTAGCRGCIYPTMFVDATVCSKIKCLPTERRNMFQIETSDDYGEIAINVLKTKDS